MDSQPDKIEAIELDIIVDAESTTISRPPRICINSSPQLSRIDTVDTVDTEIQNQSPKRIFTDFSPEAETNIRDNQSNNLVTPTLLLTPTRNGNFWIFEQLERVHQTILGLSNLSWCKSPPGGELQRVGSTRSTRSNVSSVSSSISTLQCSADPVEVLNYAWTIYKNHLYACRSYRTK